MSYREDEKRWKRIHDMLAAEASGKAPRPVASQRTLFGIPSTVEQTIAKAVAEDEKARHMKRATQPQRIDHPLEPIFDEHSRILILGTMPSPKSREIGFYYGHPQNRFWRVLARLFDEPVATTNERRRDQLLRHHIALWDVLASCEIAGASDASITNAVPNDLSRILDVAPIEAVFCTGAKAAELYARHCEAQTGIPCVKLPSTSPANAAAKFEQLVSAYAEMLPHLHELEPPIFDIQRVIQLEQDIDAACTSLAELMDRAGTAIAHRVQTDHPGAAVAILCGNGNNGGDGWVAARELARAGRNVTVICARTPEQLKAQPARNAAIACEPILSEQGVRILANPDEEALETALSHADVIVDALLGTGFAGQTVKAPFDSWIRAANDRQAPANRAHPSDPASMGNDCPPPAFVIAADTPSGLNAQTGTTSDPCIHANQTITMMVSKPGLELPASKPYCGEVRIAPLHYLEPFM